MKTIRYTVSLFLLACLAQLSCNVDCPEAKFSISGSGQKAPATVTFSLVESGAPATDIKWDFGDGNILHDESSPAHTYTQHGEYNVTLTVWNNKKKCEKSVLTQKVVVLDDSPPPAPVADFSYQIPGNCSGACTVKFTNTSSGAASYKWSFGNNTTSTQEHPSAVYSTAGSYTVTLIATGPGGSDTTAKTLSIQPPAPQQGKVVFWETSSTGCTYITLVSIGADTKAITTFSSTTPQCDATGSATFTLDPGNYAYSASCSGTQKTGTVTVVANGCTKVQLNWPNQDGKVVFWEASSNGCANATDVTINGSTQQITSFSGSAPACGASGCANFTLAPGTYTYTAKCGSSTKTGTVTVTAGQCSVVQLTWNNTPGQAIFWVMSDLGCGVITVTIGGNSKTISSYYGSAPDCGASGCANYTLNPGTYNFTASCTNRNWSGSITVAASGCSRMQLTL